jgi:hypothetical protein
MISRAATFDDGELCFCADELEEGEVAPAVVNGACASCGKTPHTDELQAECDELARRWSALSTEIENEGFDRQAREEDGYDCGPDDDDEPGLAARIDAGRKVRDELRRKELESIEEMLSDRGARMARPYEHWNEEERFMEYSERER